MVLDLIDTSTYLALNKYFIVPYPYNRMFFLFPLKYILILLNSSLSLPYASNRGAAESMAICDTVLWSTASKNCKYQFYFILFSQVNLVPLQGNFCHFDNSRPQEGDILLLCH